MTKTAFLKELKWQLQFKLPKREVADILSDYEEYFQTGISEGKSEEEICLSFGDPCKIAVEITANSTSTLLNETLVFIRETLPYILLILSAILPFYKFYTGNDSGIYTAVYVLVVPVIMMFCLYNKTGNEPLIKKFWLILAISGEAVLIAVITRLSIVIPTSSVSHTLVPQNVVNLQKILSLILAAIALITWLYAVELSKKHGKAMFSLFYLQAGVFATGVCFYHYLNVIMLNYMLADQTHLFTALVLGLSVAIMAYVILKGDIFTAHDEDSFPSQSGWNIKRALAFCLVISSLSLCTGQMLMHSSFHIYWGFAYVIIIPPVIAILMRKKDGTALRISNLDNKHSEEVGLPKKKLILLIGLVASQLIVFTLISVMMFRLIDFNRPIFLNIPPENMGLIFTCIFLFGGIFNIFIWLYELVNINLFKGLLLRLSFFNAGILATLYCFYSIIGTLSEPELILGNIIEAHYLILAGVGLAVLSSIPYIVNRIHKEALQ